MVNTTLLILTVVSLAAYTLSETYEAFSYGLLSHK